MKDGAIRPDQVVGHDFGHPETEAYQQQTADSIYAYFEQVIEERAGSKRDDLISHFLHAEVDGERLSHEEILDICFLLPHRRARHRHGLARLHLRVSRCSTPSSAEDRRGP